MKIQQVRNHQVLVKIQAPQTLKKVKGLLVQPGKTAFYVGEIIELGHKCSDDLKKGQQALIYAQALSRPIDAPQLANMTEDKEHDYFLIFEDQLDAILVEEESNLISDASEPTV